MRRRSEASGHPPAAAMRASAMLRPAEPADLPALRRLAQLDSRRLPPEPHVIAVRDGRLWAAHSLATREVVADPFQRTLKLVTLLRSHAGPLCVARPERSTARTRLRARLAPT